MHLRLRTCFAHHTRLKEKAERGLISLPSTTPSLPAPGRRLIILRNDAIIPPPGVFLAEDGIITLGVMPGNDPSLQLASSSLHSASGERPATPVGEPTTEAGRPTEANSAAKRRWSILRTFGIRANSPSPPGSPEYPGLGQKGMGFGNDTGELDLAGVPTTTAVQRKATFKFSLESMPQQPFNVRDKHLHPARLPAVSQTYLDGLDEELAAVIDLSECNNLNASHWTYSGRALAEWVLVIVEYENFFERRKSEGRETDKDVETPSLGVESLRKL